MFKQICLYCNRRLGTTEEPGNNEERISHGVCPDCFPKLVAGSGEPFADFLDSLPAPVFVVSRDGRIVTANAHGRELASKEVKEVQNHPGGEVFNCKHAHLPGGCGETIHCKTCTIRLTVMKTFETGKPSVRIPAYMDLGDRTGVKTIRFLISTEKAEDVVLLRIDDARPTTNPAE